MRFLVYFADPLCSWCYGFGPELATFLAGQPGLRCDVVMGGLRPYNKELMSDEMRAMLRGHWKHVHEESGLPFTETILARRDFVYDTEPACRAVITVRAMDAARALPMLKAVQSAFYAQGRDATQAGVLADIAQECGVDRNTFLASFESPAMSEETRRDFSTAKEMGVAGFPTLAAGYETKQFLLLANGFTRAAVLRDRLADVDAFASRGRVPLPHES